MTLTPDIISLATNAHHRLTSVVKDQAELKTNKQTIKQTKKKQKNPKQTNPQNQPIISSKIHNLIDNCKALTAIHQLSVESISSLRASAQTEMNMAHTCI